VHLNHDLVGVRHVSSDEVHPCLNQARDEVDVTSQTVNFGEQQRGTCLLAQLKRCTKLGATVKRVTTLTSLNLGEALYDRFIASCEVSLNGLTLRFKPKT
jgi:hypothetical protein